MSEQSTVVTPPAVAPAAPGKLSRRRRIGVWSLVILASIIGFLSILTTFVNRQLLDNNSWNKASAQVDPGPAGAQRGRDAARQPLYNNVDVAAQLQTRLPKNLQQLAAPAAGALREPATKAVEYLLAQPRFQQLFVQREHGRAPEARQRAREQDRATGSTPATAASRSTSASC